jgi:hypothetical protein
MLFYMKLACAHHKAITEVKVWLHILFNLVLDGVGGITSKFLIIAMIVTVHVPKSHKYKLS